MAASAANNFNGLVGIAGSPPSLNESLRQSNVQRPRGSISTVWGHQYFALGQTPSLTMKCGLRFAFSIACLILIFLWFLKQHVEDILDQYSGGSYFVDSFNAHFHPETINFPQGSTTAQNVEAGDKIIVMAKLEEEDTDWVQEELPDWQRAIYIVNPSPQTLKDPQTLTTPANKGHESMAYLSYIVDNYDKLPRTVAFLHSHRSGLLQAWHVDAPLHNNVLAMRMLQLDYVQRSGYVNLRCKWNPGCKKEHRINTHVTQEVWEEIFWGTSTPPRNSSSSATAWTTTTGEEGAGAGDDDNNNPLPQGMEKPKEVAAACCAQFAVSRDQIRKRPVEDYIHFRDWILQTKKSDASSGRVMEYLWHIVFGKDAVL
ncbi:hypothetical protein ACO22_02436 [Paracoccidioides brasiliensis]|uniref:Uncharacterized protein n=1 Tax=Paracoccidioides brasiliensis TaxID=121759 RepID=A0A1D2JIR9_PARBR|nr:hypothetical protein ACO22_02436 [Paracoccidioides brasiliensis]